MVYIRGSQPFGTYGTPQAANSITPFVASGGWEDVHTVHNSQQVEPPQVELFLIQETTALVVPPPVASQPLVMTNDDLPVPTQTTTNTTEPPIPFCHIRHPNVGV
jgi:hypothetical protein